MSLAYVNAETEWGITDQMFEDMPTVAVAVMPGGGSTTEVDDIERGLVLVFLPECTRPGEPHDHSGEVPLAMGRVSYHKALNLAIVLMQFATRVMPFDASERATVGRINERIAEALAQAQEQTQYHADVEPGEGYNVI